MDPVHVTKKEMSGAEAVWEFVVAVGREDTDLIGFLVYLEKAYWQELTNGLRSPEELVKSSFEFLLKKESKYLILREFDLRDIQGFFPEYEEEMKKMLHVPS
ncbi:MAG: hypothetical protein Q8P39_00265 [Candidatus Yanofskybacteria bacterium]|nr:hypothetical protein [Candidatus Yanofskybacteria bacterium]